MPPTDKARQTREHILETALTLFREQGYNKTTLRDIASRAEISLGLTYRYFGRKEELVAALYEQLTLEAEKGVDLLSSGPLSQRLVSALRQHLKHLSPYREALAALFGAALQPDSEVAVLGPATDGIRQRVRAIYRQLLQDSRDAPPATQLEDVTTLCYALHLNLILFWLQDRSPQQRRTDELLEFLQGTLGSLRLALKLPPVARGAARLANILSPMFGSPGEA